MKKLFLLTFITILSLGATASELETIQAKVYPHPIQGFQVKLTDEFNRSISVDTNDKEISKYVDVNTMKSDTEDHALAKIITEGYKTEEIDYKYLQEGIIKHYTSFGLNRDISLKVEIRQNWIVGTELSSYNIHALDRDVVDNREYKPESYRNGRALAKLMNVEANLKFTTQDIWLSSKTIKLTNVYGTKVYTAKVEIEVKGEKYTLEIAIDQDSAEVKEYDFRLPNI